jgi:hypothetical protein
MGRRRPRPHRQHVDAALQGESTDNPSMMLRSSSFWYPCRTEYPNSSRHRSTNALSPGGLLIKEAKRRHRRRLSLMAVVALACVGLAVAGVMLGSTPARLPAGKPKTAHLPGPASAAGATCSAAQLHATVAFNQTGTDLGAIKFTNSSAEACSLSGQPEVFVVNGAGRRVDLAESKFARAGLPPGTSSPVVLSSSSRQPHAIVELDWSWCGTPLGAITFEVEFPGWSSPLVVPNSAISPAGFSPQVPAGCPGTALFAVDVVRGFSQNGIAVPTS